MRNIIILALILASCAPQKRLNRKVNRVERFARKHSLTISDTIIINHIDTITTPEIVTDTILSATEVHDTVYIEKDRLKIKYVKLPQDSVYIEGKCESDTIIKTIQIPVEVEKIKVVEKVKKLNWFLIISGLILIFILYKKLTE